MSSIAHPRAVITGGIDGECFDVARRLAAEGVELTLASHDESAGEQARTRILQEVPGACVTVLPIDLASLRSIASFAASYLSSVDAWDILINGARVRSVPGRVLTHDGFEWHFGVNYLGAFALTGLLLPGARAGARVVTRTSRSALDSTIRFHDLRWDHGYSSSRALAMSEVAVAIFARELQRRVDDETQSAYRNDITCTLVDTDMSVQAVRRLPVVRQLVPSERAQVTRALFNASLDQEPSGERVLPGPDRRIGIRDEALAALRLWRISTQLTRISW